MKKVISFLLTLGLLSVIMVPAFAIEPERSTTIGTATRYGVLVDYQEYIYGDGIVGYAYLYEKPMRASGVKDVTEYYTELDRAGIIYTEFYINAVFEFTGTEVSCGDWSGEFTYKDSQSTYSKVARGCSLSGDTCEVRFTYSRQPPFSGEVRHSGYLYCDADGNTSMRNP